VYLINIYIHIPIYKFTYDFYPISIVVAVERGIRKKIKFWVGRKSGEGSGLYFISQTLDGFWFKYCFCLLSVVVGGSCLPPSYGESGQRNDLHIPKRAGITSICPRTVCNLWPLDELLPSYIHINRFYISTHGCVSRNWIIALDSIVPMKGSCSLLRHGKPGQTISPELSDVLTRLGMERF